MVQRYILPVILAAIYALPICAAQGETGQVAVKGLLLSDESGLFIRGDGATYSIQFAGGDQSALRGTANALIGEKVVATGTLQVQAAAGNQSKFVLFADSIGRASGETVRYVPAAPVIEEREVIHDRDSNTGVHVPGVDIDNQGLRVPGVNVNW